MSEEHTALTEQRLEHMCELMRSIEWRRGKTGKLLAAKWDLSMSRVDALAAVAWKRVKAEVIDTDSTTATICSALRSIVEESHAETHDTDQSVKRDARRAITEAGKAWAAITIGTKETTTHAFSTGEPTPQDAASAVNAMFGKVTPQADPDAAKIPSTSANTGDEPEPT